MNSNFYVQVHPRFINIIISTAFSPSLIVSLSTLLFSSVQCRILSRRLTAFVRTHFDSFLFEIYCKEPLFSALYHSTSSDSWIIIWKLTKSDSEMLFLSALHHWHHWLQHEVTGSKVEKELFLKMSWNWPLQSLIFSSGYLFFSQTSLQSGPLTSVLEHFTEVREKDRLSQHFSSFAYIFLDKSLSMLHRFQLMFLRVRLVSLFSNSPPFPSLSTRFHIPSDVIWWGHHCLFSFYLFPQFPSHFFSGFDVGLSLPFNVMYWSETITDVSSSSRHSRRFLPHALLSQTTV